MPNTMIEHFVLLDEEMTDVLEKNDWPIPNSYCAPYTFGLKIVAAQDASITGYYGGLDSATE